MQPLIRISQRLRHRSISNWIGLGSRTPQSRPRSSCNRTCGSTSFSKAGSEALSHHRAQPLVLVVLVMRWAWSWMDCYDRILTRWYYKSFNLIGRFPIKPISDRSLGFLSGISSWERKIFKVDYVVVRERCWYTMCSRKSWCYSV
jgi:hypothetical protein